MSETMVSQTGSFNYVININSSPTVLITEIGLRMFGLPESLTTRVGFMYVSDAVYKLSYWCSLYAGHIDWHYNKSTPYSLCILPHKVWDNAAYGSCYTSQHYFCSHSGTLACPYVCFYHNHVSQY